MFADHYAKYYDLFNDDKKYAKEIDFVYDWAGKPQSILDIGCGTASYWKYFPDNIDMTGIEQSCPMMYQSTYRNYIIQANIQRVKFGKKNLYDCVTALFDVINYIPDHSWWNRLPLKSGGYFIFDIFDKQKVDKQGFQTTVKTRGYFERYIRPISYDGKVAVLKAYLSGYDEHDFLESEQHKLYIWSESNIRRMARKSFEIVEIKKTKRWQTWYKLRKK